MEVNLAPWRYRNALVSDGGPIARIAARRTQSSFKDRKYEAFAYLDPAFTPRPDTLLYGKADGTGSSSSYAEASYKAISEALERWAFAITISSPEAARYGFDRNPTTTGMAAFPGIFRNSPRRIAFNEAVERWSLCSWWEGKLAATPVHLETAEISAIAINTPWSDRSVVILYGTTPGGAHCYSFACEKDVLAASRKARIEYERNFEILEHLSQQASQSVKITDPFELRLLYFSREPGRSHFNEVLTRSLKITSSAPRPALIVDCDIPGPWSRYASIWRCLFERDEAEALSPRSDYFLF